MELRITNKILDMAEDPRGFDVQPPVSEAREELAALTSERVRLREALTAIRALSMLPADGNESMSDDPMTLLSEIADFASAALDKDA